MTTLICDFQDIVGGRINGYATLAAGEVRVGQDGPTVVLRTPSTPEQVVEGEATFQNVDPGPAILHLHWDSQSTTLRFTVPNTPETVKLSECIEQTLEYTPPVVNRGIDLIEGARDDAIAQVDAAAAQAVDAEVGEFKTKAELALTKSTDALSKSTTAESAAGNAVSRVDALEAMAGLSPESPVDGQTANLVLQGDSLTRAAISGLFAEDPPGSGLYSIP